MGRRERDSDWKKREEGRKIIREGVRRRGWQLSLLGGGERGGGRTIHERHVEPLNTCERIPFEGKSELNVTPN